MLTLRPFQRNALNALELDSQSRRHVLCVAPTGSGKSLIFQKAIRGKRALLITPLVALARQQRDELRKLNISTNFGSQQIPPRKSGTWILSPESLLSASLESKIQNWQPEILVVDECHCLWEWGENFRPAFQRIPNLLQLPSILKSLWLTATLPHTFRLELRKLISCGLVELGKFDLPENLSLFIHETPWSRRLEVLYQWIKTKTGCGIIFVATRELTLRISRYLCSTGINATYYHAGLSTDERQNIEAQISRGIPNVIVSTSAFGMGMNYPTLQYCVLLQAPLSLLSLVQSIGRVARNENKTAEALVLWNEDDFRMTEWAVRESPKKAQELQELIDFLKLKLCRRQALKYYFDKRENSTPCGLCDFCFTNFN